MTAIALHESGATTGPVERGLHFSPRTQFQLTRGKAYPVMGLGIFFGSLEVLVRDDYEFPAWHAAGLFAISAGPLPDDWKFVLWDGVAASYGNPKREWAAMWGYDALVADTSHSDGLLEYHVEPLRIFFREWELRRTALDEGTAGEEFRYIRDTEAAGRDDRGRDSLAAICLRELPETAGPIDCGRHASSGTRFALTRGTVYPVMGLGIVEASLEALVRDDSGEPCWCPAGLFDIPAAPLPRDWGFALWDGVAASYGHPTGEWAAMWGYDALVSERTHSDALTARDAEALRTFHREWERRRAAITNEGYT
jgi:hypothetical protein